MAHFSCKPENEATTFRSIFQTKGLVLRNRRIVCEELTACLCNFVGSFQNRVGRKINSVGRKRNCEGRNSENIGKNHSDMPFPRVKNRFCTKGV